MLMLSMKCGARGCATTNDANWHVACVYIWILGKETLCWYHCLVRKVSYAHSVMFQKNTDAATAFLSNFILLGPACPSMPSCPGLRMCTGTCHLRSKDHRRIAPQTPFDMRLSSLSAHTRVWTRYSPATFRR